MLDVGTRISAPFCAGLLGEMGAEVIKVEPRGGDFMRTIGPFVPTGDGPGYSLLFAVEGRGRRGVTCDLRRPEGQDLFRRLAATADVVCENFRPGTMEAWHSARPTAIRSWCACGSACSARTVRTRRGPGLDRLGIAYGGLLNLTGYRDRPPVRPGVTISDYLTGTFAAEAVLAALYRRDHAGRGGEVMDAPLYGSILRILEWTVAAQDRLGLARHREGNRLANSAPLDNYATADGQVRLHRGRVGRQLRAALRRRWTAPTCSPTLASTLAQRAAASDEINDLVADWAAARTAAEIEAVCIAHDVPVGTAYDAAEILADPHMAARGDLVMVDDPVIGPTAPAGAVPPAGRRPTSPAPARRASASTTVRSGATWWAHRRGARRPGGARHRAKDRAGSHG